MFELIPVVEPLRCAGYALINMDPHSGRVKFGAKACAAHRFHLHKYAVVYHDKVTGELAIEFTSKDGVKGARPIIRPADVNAKNPICYFRGRTLLQELKITSTTLFPYEMRVVKIKRSGDAGDVDEREMCVISLAAGTPPQQRNNKSGG
jgi:hypothetical protein